MYQKKKNFFDSKSFHVALASLELSMDHAGFELSLSQKHLDCLGMGVHVFITSSQSAETDG